ncbi:MAG: adenylyl-sulfate reductase subunit alpha [Clostridia bacterium]|nr:adenylyl-sulfate reductase subunit alpha [Clostridia bacterium]
MPVTTVRKSADVLIIGGGTAGCYAALTLSERDPEKRILVVEKANILRSGCLAAGVNALNAYITKGHTPDFYVDYALRDAHGIAREDLLLSMSEHLNEVTERLEDLGLVILKDENGEYVARGNRNLKINGENIKPLLANEVLALPNVEVLNEVNVVGLHLEAGASKDAPGVVTGAYGHGVREEVLYDFRAPAVLVATGGAAGIYRPNHPGFSRHKMWYSPFNTGAGYAMGILAGAEMTTFEMRFIALRCKDTIAPTGTLAQGVGARQVNALGDVYEDKYGLTTSQRVWGTVAETKAGRGPCYLRTVGIGEDAAGSLEKAYLNMEPSQTLKWVAAGKNANEENVEIEGTEPYITGGHTASGYWVDDGRRTTVSGLYAAGDVAGGSPQKYVTGALAEGLLAAKSIEEDLNSGLVAPSSSDSVDSATSFATLLQDLLEAEGNVTPEELEAALQTTMDTYAGGIGSGYEFTESSLEKAKARVRELLAVPPLQVSCSTMRDVTHYFEVRERLVVAEVLLAHLKARKETRWHCFAENKSFPEQDDEGFLCYVNSRYRDGAVETFTRPLSERRPEKTAGTERDYRDFTGRWANEHSH